MTNTYIHQPAPDMAPVTFSDRPAKAHGVTYIPKWSWSAGYRKFFNKTHGKASATLDIHDRATAYRDWYEGKFNKECPV